MLIICNGTFKSGSSWLHHIIQEILRLRNIKVSDIPISYNRDVKSPTRILEKNLQGFILNEDINNNFYLTKAHYFQKDTLNRIYSEDIVFFFINRDIRDSIVSHYHHFINFRKMNISFTTYFRFIGIFKAYEMYLFKKRCKESFRESHFFTFESLKNDFPESIKRVAYLLGIDNLSNKEIDIIRNNTLINKMRDKSVKGDLNYYPELKDQSWKLFRKGNIGDWKLYFNNINISIIDNIINGNASSYIKVIYYLIFTLRRKILG